MITTTSLKHPVMVDKILAGLIVASDLAQTEGHGKAYIENSKGHNIMRLDVFQPGYTQAFPVGGVVVYGDQSKQITGLVESALGLPLISLI